MPSYHYENPHISLSGTLDFLQSASNVEVEMAFDNGDECNPLEIAPRKLTAGGVHEAYEAFLSDFESSPSVEKSFAICWQPLSFLRKLVYMTDEEAGAAIEHQRAYLRRLPAIVSRMEPEVGPDEYVPDKDAAIFIHLSVGLILLAEQVEGGQSERQWEWLDRALRTFRRTENSTARFYERTKFPRTLALSYEIAKALMLCKSASRLFHQRKYEESFREYGTASIGIWIANNDILHWWGNEDNLPDDTRHTEFVIDVAFESDLLEDEYGEPLSGMRHWDTSKFIFDFDNAVKAFDALIGENARDTDWPQIANICWLLRKNWHLLSRPINSEHIPEEETVEESWTIARGIVLNMMSNDERIKELRRDADYKVEDRLRLYFFGETWDNLPDKARAALISADREYENHRGRRPVIFDHLRHAVRAVVVEVLAKPYQEFVRSKAAAGIKSLSDLQSVVADIEDDRSGLDLDPLIKSLFDASHFDEFLDARSFSSADRRFVKNRVRGKLLYLNGVANTSSHDHSRTYRSFENDIRETYAEFLGIGRNGILPRLMSLHTKATARPLQF